LKRWSIFTSVVPATELEEKAGLIYSELRCALHHREATGSNCRVRVSGPPIVFNGDKIELNRETFHQALKAAFSQYVVELNNPANARLRENFRTKMDGICS
jgi:hypothetical protein